MTPEDQNDPRQSGNPLVGQNKVMISQQPIANIYFYWMIGHEMPLQGLKIRATTSDKNQRLF